MSKLKPNFTQIPNEIIDNLMSMLSGSDFKVLVYICRRTFGFQKMADSISISQIMNGITSKKGEVLDKGTGLSNRVVINSIKNLTGIGIIKGIKEKGKTTSYAIDLTYDEKSPVTKSHNPYDEKSHVPMTKSHTQKKEKESIQKKDNTDLSLSELKKIYFEDFWKLYPVKKSKKVSEQKWNKLPHKTQQIIIEDIQKRIHDSQWKSGYIPHASTYINQERWEDEITINSPNNKSKSIGVIGFN